MDEIKLLFPDPLSDDIVDLENAVSRNPLYWGGV